jgi:electron transfer flavoprotein beta subunit
MLIEVDLNEPMKIAVCFKAIPNFDQVVEADWDNFSLVADWSYVKRVFSCFDESALETALRLRSAWEKMDEKTECMAITAAPLPPPLCKILFAAGFDRVLDLSRALPEEAAGVEFQPRRIAAILGTCLGPAACDLILTGSQAGYADTGMVPLLLAELLGIPALTGVEELSPCAGGIEVRRIAGGGRERLQVRLPLLAALGNSPISALRAVTLSDRMAASKRDAESPPVPNSSSFKAFGVTDGPDTGEAPRFHREELRKSCRFLPAGGDLSQSVAEIRAEYLREWER